MLFNSIEFIGIFFPLLCAAIFFLQKVKNSQWLLIPVLLGGSLIFYAYHSLSDLLLMLCSILINFRLSQYIFRKKYILIIGIIFNISLIIYFKYIDFFLENLGNILSMQFNIAHSLLPLGISFFTFQQIAYLVDAYYGELTEKNILKYALLVSFFPHAIAGPLVQYKEISPQFKGITLTSKNFSIGSTIFILGLFKKIVIADGLSPCVNAVFDNAAEGMLISFAESWFGAIGYTLQLYFDFSGYSDMAIGLAKIFNINFPMNFYSPYKATSIIDFWRKWHITLSLFLKKYLYIPLGGNQYGQFRKYSNLFITMLLGGIWHGANWTFILWGMMHGSFLIINHLWRNCWEGKALPFFYSTIYKIMAWGVTLFAVIIAWVLFRAENIHVAWSLYRSMFGMEGISLSPILQNRLPAWSIFYYEGFFNNQIFYFVDYLPYIIGGMIICLFLPNVKSFMNINAAKGIMWVPTTLYAIVMSCLSSIVFLVLLSQRKIEFLYFNF